MGGVQHVVVRRARSPRARASTAIGTGRSVVGLLRRLASLALLLGGVVVGAAPVVAQPVGLPVTALVLGDADVSPREIAAVQLGLRRGVADASGVRLVHPADVLSEESIPEELQWALDELEPLTEQLRTGDPHDVAQRAQADLAIFEQHLAVVRRESLVDAMMLAGLAHCRMGHERECEERLSRVVVFRENMTYDAERFPRDLAPTFLEVQRRVLEGARVTLTVRTQPENAEVFVDGRSYGLSPAEVPDLLVGDHYVTVKHNEYRKYVDRVHVSRGERVHTATLSRSPGARLIGSPEVLGALRDEAGDRQTGQEVRSLAITLGVDQLVLGVLARTDVGLELVVYVYDLRTQVLLAQDSETLGQEGELVERASLVAARLYERVDRGGRMEAPRDEAAPSRPITEEWWFWTALGVAAVGVGVTVGVVVAANDTGVPSGFTRFTGTIP